MSTLLPQTPTGGRVVELLKQLGGSTTLPNRAIAEALGVSTDAVKKAVRRLEDGGLLVVERRRRNHHAGDPAGRTMTLTGAPR